MDEAVTRADTDDGGEKYSKAESHDTDGNNKGLNRNTIQALQGITQKSINSLTSAELQNAAPVAKRYWEQLGVKSPFFRAWFGDWRVNDTTPIEIADKAGSTRKSHHNNDTGWEIRVSRQIFNETMAHNAEKNTSARPYLPYIDDIIKKPSCWTALQWAEIQNQKTLFLCIVFMRLLTLETGANC